jgi:hypothetical protein
LAHALDRSPTLGDDSRGTGGTGGTLWNNAQTVIELGSGTGALGLYAAHVLGACAVLLTDLAPNLELLRSNRDLNRLQIVHGGTEMSCPTVDVVALDWTDTSLPSELMDWKKRYAPYGVDVILGSDLFLPYAADLLDPLARTLRDLFQSIGHSDTVAILAYEERFDCTAFFEWATHYGLCTEPIDNALLHPVYSDAGRIHVLKIRPVR